MEKGMRERIVEWDGGKKADGRRLNGRTGERFF